MVVALNTENTKTFQKIDISKVPNSYPESVKNNEEDLQSAAGVSLNEDYKGVRESLAADQIAAEEDMLYTVTQSNIKTGAVSPEAGAVFVKNYKVDTSPDVSLETAAASKQLDESYADNQHVAINSAIDGDQLEKIKRNLILQTWEKQERAAIEEGINPVDLTGDIIESFFQTQLLENTADRTVFEGKKTLEHSTQDLALRMREVVFNSPTTLDYVNNLKRVSAVIHRYPNKAEQMAKLDYFLGGGDEYVDVGGYVEGVGMLAGAAAKGFKFLKAVGNVAGMSKAVKEGDKTLQITEGVLKSIGLPNAKADDIASAGKVSEATAEVAADKQALKASQLALEKGIYNEDELAEISSAEQKQWKAKLQDTSLDPIDIKTIEDDTGALHTVVVIGNEEGKAMTIKEARKQARHLGLDGANSGLVRDGEGAFIYTEYAPTQTNVKGGYDSWLIKGTRWTGIGRGISGPLNYIKRKFLGSAISASKEANARAVVAESKQMGNMKILVKEYETNLGKLNKQQVDKLNEINSKQHNGKGVWLSDDELRDLGADDKVIQVMHDYRRLYEEDFMLINESKTREAHYKGVRQYNDVVGTKQSIKAHENDGSIIVRDTSGELVEDLSRFSDDDYFLVKLYDMGNDNAPANTTHILMPKINTQETKISKNLIGYQAGGPRDYMLGEYFIKTGSSMFNPKTGNKIKGFVKTITTATNPKSAAKAKKEIEAVLDIARRHDISDAVGIQKELDELDNELFKVDNYEQFKALVSTEENTKGLLDPDYDVQILRHGQSYSFKDGTFEEFNDADSALSNLIQNQQKFYTSRGNVLDSVNGEHARLIDIKESFDKMIEKASRIDAYNELYMWYDKELNKYKDLIVNWNSIKDLSIQNKLIEAQVGTFARAGREGEDLLRVRALESLMDHGQRILNSRTTADKVLDSAMTHVARWLDAVSLHTLDDKAIESVAKFNPVGFAKGCIYDMAMMLNIPQVILQTAGTVNTAMTGKWLTIQPVRAVFGWLPYRMSLVMENLGLGKAQNVFEKGAKAAFMMNDEAWSKFRWLMKEGGGDFIAGLQVGYSKSQTKSFEEGSKSIFRQLEHIALMPVNEANAMNYIVASAIAVMNNPKGSLRELSAVAHSLNTNMTKAGASKLQSGKTFIPLDTYAQWSAYPLHFMEVAGDKNLTKEQRAKYYLSSMLLTGGVVGSLLPREAALNANQWLVNKGMPVDMADMLTTGYAAAWLKEEYGLTIDLGAHGMEILQPFIDLVTDPTNFDIMANIPVANLGNQFTATAHAIKQLMLPDDNVYDYKRVCRVAASLKGLQSGLKNLARWCVADYEGRYYSTGGAEVVRGLDKTQAALIGIAGATPVEARENRDNQAAMRSVEDMYKLADEDMDTFNKNIQYYWNDREDEPAYLDAMKARQEAYTAWLSTIRDKWGNQAALNWGKRQYGKLYSHKNITKDTRKAATNKLGIGITNFIKEYTHGSIR